MKFNLFFNSAASKHLVYNSQEAFWLNSLFNIDFNFLGFLRFIFYEVFFSYNFEATYNPVLWSIQNEFIGSLFIFAVFGIVKKNKNRFYIYVILLCLLYCLSYHQLLVFLIGYIFCDLDFSPSHHKLIYRIKEIENQIFKYKIGTLLLFVILLFSSKIILVNNHAENYQIYLTQSFLILYFSIRNSILKEFLSLKWIYRFGTISFSFYLLHLIVICSLSSFLMQINLALPFKIFIILITFIVSVFVSVIFYRFIDKFAIEKSKLFANYFAENKRLS